MKGLLIKDMSLMLGQKRFFLIVLGMGGMLMVTSEDPSSAMGYVMMLMTIFSLNTFSYDEHENGMSFLMTLPINRKLYVLEKYVFTGILACASGVLATVMTCGVSIIRNLEVNIKEILATGGVLMAMSFFIFAVTLPLMIKFGSEKGRVALFAVFAVIGVIVTLVMKGLEATGSNLSELIMFLDKMSVSTIVFAGAAVLFVMVLVSYLAAVSIISKKEY